MEEHRHPSEKAHPSPAKYVVVGTILMVITAIEVAAFYLDVSSNVLIPIFIGLSVLKFVMVVAFFMHLKYDHRIFSFFFTGGLLLAVGVGLALIALFGNFDVGAPNVAVVAPTPTPRAMFTPTPGPTRDTPLTPVATTPSTFTHPGEAVFLSIGCSGCHTIEGLAGAAGTFGPDLTHVAAVAGGRKAGLNAEEYFRESIEEPNAFVVEGFSAGMAPLRSAMSGDEFEDLVAYLLTLE